MPRAPVAIDFPNQAQSLFGDWMGTAPMPVFAGAKAWSGPYVQGAGDGKVCCMYGSTDSGATWSLADDAHAPAYPPYFAVGSSYNGFTLAGAEASGSTRVVTIAVCTIAAGVEATFAVVDFDLVTGTYGTLSPPFTHGLKGVSQTWPFRLPAGLGRTTRVVYAGRTPVTIADVVLNNANEMWFVDYDPSGPGWGTPVLLSDALVNDPSINAWQAITYASGAVVQHGGWWVANRAVPFSDPAPGIGTGWTAVPDVPPMSGAGNELRLAAHDPDTAITHVLWWHYDGDILTGPSASDIRYRRVAADATVSAVATAWNLLDLDPPLPYSTATRQIPWIMSPYASGLWLAIGNTFAGSCRTDILVTANTDTPVWTRTRLVGPAAPDPYNGLLINPAITARTGTPELLAIGLDPGGSSAESSIYRYRWNGAGWDGPFLYYDLLANPPADAPGDTGIINICG